MKRTAQCCCGEITVEAAGNPEQHGMCHCDNCKKRTGSAYGLSAYFNADNVKRLSGNPVCYELQSPNDGALQQRYFCSICGTTVFWTISILPDLVGVAGGCFTENPLDKPSYSVSNQSKYSWVALPEGIEIKQ